MLMLSMTTSIPISIPTNTATSMNIPMYTITSIMYIRNIVTHIRTFMITIIRSNMSIQSTTREETVGLVVQEETAGPAVKAGKVVKAEAVESEAKAETAWEVGFISIRAL